MKAIIIQARTSSTRLRNKVLKKLYKNKSVLDLCIDSLSSLNTKIIIATSKNEEDTPIIDIALKHNLDYYRGDEENVLQRYIDCAKIYKVSEIIRVTSDNVFVQPKLIKPLIKNKNLNLDYISYKVKNKNAVLTHWGLFGEYVTLKALEKVKSLSSQRKDLEHVTYYIYNHPNEFNLELWDVPPELNRNDIRLTIDTIEDFKICQTIMYYLKYNGLKPDYENILEFIEKRPEIIKQINLQIQKIDKLNKS